MGNLTVEAVREMALNKESVVGLTFTNARGSCGVVLEALSPHGKRQAELTCTEPGCAELHIREQSDWGQSYKCRTHSKTKAKAAGAGQNMGGGIVGDNGETFRFQRVLESDDAETVALKGQNNAIFEALKATRVAVERAEKEAKATERKAVQAKAREEKAAKQAAEKKAARTEQIARMRSYAAKNNIPLSDVTLKQLESES